MKINIHQTLLSTQYLHCIDLDIGDETKTFVLMACMWENEEVEQLGRNT